MAGTLPPIVATLIADTAEFQAKMEEAKLKMAEVSDEGSDSMSAMSSVGKAALFGIAGAAVAVGAASIDLGMKFQDATARLAANAGISTKAANDIGNAMMSTAGKTIFSATSLTTSYAAVAAELGVTEGHALSATQALSFMKDASDLAEGSGVALGDATNDLGQIMQSYGIKVNGATAAANALFQSSRLSGNSLDSVTQAMQRLHTQLGVTTPPLAQTGALLVDMAHHGATGSVAIRTMSTAMTTLLKPMLDVQTSTQKLTETQAQLPPSLQKLGQAYLDNKVSSTEATTAADAMNASQAEAWTAFTSAAGAVTTAKNAYADLGLNVTNAKGQFVGISSIIAQLQPKLAGMTQAQQLATVTQIFGAKAAKELLTTIDAGPAAYDSATKAVERQNAVHEAAVKQQETLSHEIETIEAEFEDYGAKLGTFLIPRIEDLIHVTSEVVDWFDHNRAAAVALATIIAGFLANAIESFISDSIDPMIASIKNVATQFGLMAPAASQAEEDVDSSATGMESALSALSTDAENVGTGFTAAQTTVETAMTGMASAVSVNVAAIEADLATLQGDIDATLLSLGELKEAGGAVAVAGGGAATDEAAGTTDEAAGSTDAAATALDSAATALDTSAASLESAAAALKTSAADTATSAADMATADEDTSAAAAALKTSAADTATSATDTATSAEDLAGSAEDIATSAGELAAKSAVGGVAGGAGEGEGEAAGEDATTEDAIGEGIARSMLKGSMAEGLGLLIAGQLYTAFLEKDVGKIVGQHAAAVLGDAATGAAIGLAIAGPFGAAAGAALAVVIKDPQGTKNALSPGTPSGGGNPFPLSLPNIVRDIGNLFGGSSGGSSKSSSPQQVIITGTQVALAQSSDLAKQESTLQQLQTKVAQQAALFGADSPQELAAVKALQQTESEWLPKLQTEAAGQSQTQSLITKLTAQQAAESADASKDQSIASQLHADLTKQEATLAAAKSTLAQDNSIRAGTLATNAAKTSVDNAKTAVDETKTFLASTNAAAKAASTKADDDANAIKLQQAILKNEKDASDLVTQIKSGVSITKLPSQTMKASGSITLKVS